MREPPPPHTHTHASFPRPTMAGRNVLGLSLCQINCTDVSTTWTCSGTGAMCVSPVATGLVCLTLCCLCRSVSETLTRLLEPCLNLQCHEDLSVSVSLCVVCAEMSTTLYLLTGLLWLEDRSSCLTACCLCRGVDDIDVLTYLLWQEGRSSCLTACCLCRGVDDIDVFTGATCELPMAGGLV